MANVSIHLGWCSVPVSVKHYSFSFNALRRGHSVVGNVLSILVFELNGVFLSPLELFVVDVFVFELPVFKRDLVSFFVLNVLTLQLSFDCLQAHSRLPVPEVSDHFWVEWLLLGSRTLVL